jgi:hypothetical protein
LRDVLQYVSPEYLLRSGRSPEDRKVLASIVPEIQKRPRDAVNDENKFLNLACRRKKSIEFLMGNTEPEIDSAHQDLSEESDSHAHLPALHSFPTFRT